MGGRRLLRFRLLGQRRHAKQTRTVYLDACCLVHVGYELYRGDGLNFFFIMISSHISIALRQWAVMLILVFNYYFEWTIGSR